MEHDSMDYFQIFKQTDDKCSTRSKSLSSLNDSQQINDDYDANDHSSRSITDLHFKTSKKSANAKAESNYFKNLPGAMPISMNQMLSIQNNNAPWFVNMLKNRFHRSKRTLNKSIDEFVEKPISSNGTSGRWIVRENDLIFPSPKDNPLTSDYHYNISRAMSTSGSEIQTPMSNDDSLHLCHYRYDFQSFDTVANSRSSENIHHPTTVETVAIRPDKYLTTTERQIDNQEFSFSLLNLTPTVNYSLQHEQTIIDNQTMVERESKRAKSASAAISSHPLETKSPKRGKTQSKVAAKRKKSKYSRQESVSPQEMELREALRIVDLDNVGFFPPSELRKVLKDIGIDEKDINRIEACLPLDDDGHYSTDNLIKLLLDFE